MPYQVTGNEYLSLPTIREGDGAVEGITFLYMQVKGLIEIRGADALMKPTLAVDGAQQPLRMAWTRDHYWIPTARASASGLDFSCTYLTPVGERAVVLHLTARNTDDKPHVVNIGLSGAWDQTLHEINETAEITSGRQVIRSGWNQMFIFSQKPALPLFAFAPCVCDPQQFANIDQGAKWAQQDFSYSISKETTLQPGETMTLDIPWGVGYDGVAAATSAKEALRQGYDALYHRTEKWLEQRKRSCEDPAIESLLNTNLFFAFFFASGRTVDTEEVCLMTSRSPRYYVSAAYWDRDGLLWAFPAICEVDADYAKEILRYVFTRQARNFGVHSRYIDGTMLEPGFELDELCAPVIALKRYVDKTGDKAFVRENYVLDGLRHILRVLEEKKHPDIELYETFLQPTDDMHNFIYLTYDNALVAYSFRALAGFLEDESLLCRAQRVKDALYAHAVQEQNGEMFFAWSMDLNGHYDIYDEPPGSLQLLPFYGFCEPTDVIWRNTIRMIRSCDYELSFADCPIAEIGCKHAPHPWVLSICNSLLSGHSKEALLHLTRTRMDNGIACESVNERTGACETGAAFATCAGFLSYAMLLATTEEPVKSVADCIPD